MTLQPDPNFAKPSPNHTSSSSDDAFPTLSSLVERAAKRSKSMREPEIQPPAPLDLTPSHILDPLGLTQSSPTLFLGIVAPYIVSLGEQEDKDRQDVDDDQLGVAVTVVGLVLVHVDVAVCHVA